MRADGLRLVSPAIAVVLAGTALAVALSYAFGIPMPDMSGILCGATTNTPALGAAQQTLQQAGLDANGAALSCAVTYPLGVVGVISGDRHPAQTLRPPGGHAGTRRRAQEEPLHRQLPPHESRRLRQEHPRHRRREPPPLRHLAPLAQRTGLDSHVGQAVATRRRHPGRSPTATRPTPCGSSSANRSRRTGTRRTSTGTRWTGSSCRSASW